MAKLGIMIEGQEGLSWERWRRICEAADSLGFDTLRRSDHFVSLMGEPERDCIECWTSLALAAEWTKRIQIGPMVSPMTFRLPALLARMAASVDVLSNGRLILGVGAGWNEHEHTEFGIPFFTQRERFEHLEEGIKAIRDTWKKAHPRPVRGEVPLLMGGKGRKRTLPLVAREAAEWNLSMLDAETYQERREALQADCRDIGRDPATIRSSVMAGYIIGRDKDELRERAAQVKKIVTRIESTDPDDILREQSAKWFVGTPEEVAQQMRKFASMGVDLFVLQHFLLDDRDALELLAKEVIPAVA